MKFDSKLVNAKKLLELMFDKSCRPSMTWLVRQREAGKIPCSRMGRKVFYDPADVYNKLFPGVT